MKAIRRPSHRARAALLLCVFVCGASTFAASFDDAAQSVGNRIKNRIKSALPPAPTVPSVPAPSAPPPSTPAPAPGTTSPVQTKTPPTSTDTGRFSEAEKAYVPAQATTRVADGPRRAKLTLAYGSKLSTPGDDVTITNPFLDLNKVFFAQAAELTCTADGGLIVGGRVELDKELHALGTGYWRIAADGAITPLHTRSTNTYGKTSATRCDAPYGRTHLTPEIFDQAPGGELLKGIDYAVLRIGTDGYVRRAAGAPFSCEENGNPSLVRGLVDGPADTARFNKVSRVVPDTQGNVWVVDQSACALRRIAPDGQVTTVISPEQACAPSILPEDRVGLYELAWDAVHGELVSSASFPVAMPVHNLYNTVWRIRPNGEFRRVLFSTKVSRSPAKVNLDGISALAVDPEGRIYIASRIMKFGSVLAVLRVDEVNATVVSVTGQGWGNEGPSDEPRDGPAGRAIFRYIKDMCFAPDGTLYTVDEHLLRKLDRSGRVSTWAF